MRTSGAASGHRARRCRVRPATAQAMSTSPTGLPSSSQEGPSTPVTAIAIAAPERSRAPSAISRATVSVTAPWRVWSVSDGRPSIRTFASLL